MTATAPATSDNRLRTYASFVRFEHTLFSLPLILAGVFSAPGPRMDLGRWLLVAIAAVGARTAGMSLNRIIDRHIDAKNPRTRVRELPAGRMGLREAPVISILKLPMVIIFPMLLFKSKPCNNKLAFVLVQCSFCPKSLHTSFHDSSDKIEICFSLSNLPL